MPNLNTTASLARDGRKFVGGYSIPIRLRNQQRMNDCWAACAGMILDWQGFVSNHADILARGNAIGHLLGQDSPLSTAEIARVIKTLSGGDIQFARVEEPKTRNADFWIQHINLHKPILTSMNNHCRIIMGYNGHGQFAVLDPHPDQTGPIVGDIAYLRQHLMDAYVMR